MKQFAFNLLPHWGFTLPEHQHDTTIFPGFPQTQYVPLHLTGPTVFPAVALEGVFKGLIWRKEVYQSITILFKALEVQQGKCWLWTGKRNKNSHVEECHNWCECLCIHAGSGSNVANLCHVETAFNKSDSHIEYGSITAMQKPPRGWILRFQGVLQPLGTPHRMTERPDFTLFWNSPVRNYCYIICFQKCSYEDA